MENTNQDYLNLALELSENVISKNTKKIYESDFERFRNWCYHCEKEYLPCKPDTLASYIAYLFGKNKSKSTIKRAVTSINVVHESSGYESPMTPLVKKVLTGSRRASETSIRKVRPITIDILKRITDMLPFDLCGARDKCIILFGWFGALRRSEIANLNFEDIQDHPKGLVLKIRHSKTDQTNEGFEIPIPFVDSTIDPVYAFRRWTFLSHIKKGPLFRAVYGQNDFGYVNESRISDKTVSNIVKNAIKRAGYDETNYSSHSLRSGFITTSAISGIDEYSIMSFSRHKSLSVMLEYVRVEKNWINHPIHTILEKNPQIIAPTFHKLPS